MTAESWTLTLLGLGPCASAGLVLAVWYYHRQFIRLKADVLNASTPNPDAGTRRDRAAKLAGIAAVLSGLPLSVALHFSDWAPVKIAGAVGGAALLISVTVLVLTNLSKVPLDWLKGAFINASVWKLVALVVVSFLGWLFAVTILALLLSEGYRSDLLKAFAPKK